MVIINNQMAASIYRNGILPFVGTNTTDFITFCKSPVLTDAQVKALVATTDALIVNAKVGTIASYSGLVMAPVDAAAVPPVFSSTSLPTIKTFTVSNAAAAVITHAIVKSTVGNTTQFCVVDVGLLNSGAVIQVDKTTVTTGDVVTLLAINMKFWRQ
jgi:hypothetical protein